MVYSIDKTTLLEEAAHAGSSLLSKHNLQRTAGHRNNLASDIKQERSFRDAYRSGKTKVMVNHNDNMFTPTRKIEMKISNPTNTNTEKAISKQNANYHDNKARSMSQTGNIVRNAATKEELLPQNKIQKFLGIQNEISSDDKTKLYRAKPRSIASAKS